MGDTSMQSTETSLKNRSEHSRPRAKNNTRRPDLGKFSVDTAPTLIESQKRTEHILKIFSLCDVDEDGFLKSHEMQRFAQCTGFTGSDDEWAVAYQHLCSDKKLDSSSGIETGLFIELVNDKSDAGCYCSNKELIEIIRELMLEMTSKARTIVSPSDQKPRLFKNVIAGSTASRPRTSLSSQTSLDKNSSNLRPRQKSLSSLGPSRTGSRTWVSRSLVNSKNSYHGLRETDAGRNAGAANSQATIVCVSRPQPATQKGIQASMVCSQGKTRHWFSKSARSVAAGKQK